MFEVLNSDFFSSLERPQAIESRFPDRQAVSVQILCHLFVYNAHGLLEVVVQGPGLLVVPELHKNTVQLKNTATTQSPEVITVL